MCVASIDRLTNRAMRGFAWRRMLWPRSWPVVDRVPGAGWPDAVVYEIRQTPDPQRRGLLLALVGRATEVVSLNASALARARVLHGAGFHRLDALHVALAEAARVDAFLTTDRQMVRLAARLSMGVSPWSPIRSRGCWRLLQNDTTIPIERRDSHGRSGGLVARTGAGRLDQVFGPVWGWQWRLHSESSPLVARWRS